MAKYALRDPLTGAMRRTPDGYAQKGTVGKPCCRSCIYRWRATWNCETEAWDIEQDDTLWGRCQFCPDVPVYDQWYGGTWQKLYATVGARCNCATPCTPTMAAPAPPPDPPACAYRWKATATCGSGWTVEYFGRVAAAPYDWAFYDCLTQYKATAANVMPAAPGGTAACNHLWRATVDCAAPDPQWLLEDMGETCLNVHGWTGTCWEKTLVTAAAGEPDPPDPPVCNVLWIALPGEPITSEPTCGEVTDGWVPADCHWQAITDGTDPGDPPALPEVHYRWRYSCTDFGSVAADGTTCAPVHEWADDGSCGQTAITLTNTPPAPPENVPICLRKWTAHCGGVAEDAGWFCFTEAQYEASGIVPCQWSTPDPETCESVYWDDGTCEPGTPPECDTTPPVNYCTCKVGNCCFSTHGTAVCTINHTEIGTPIPPDIYASGSLPYVSCGVWEQPMADPPSPSDTTFDRYRVTYDGVQWVAKLTRYFVTGPPGGEYWGELYSITKTLTINSCLAGSDGDGNDAGVTYNQCCRDAEGNCITGLSNPADGSCPGTPGGAAAMSPVEEDI
jgi:hypothetical protein